MSAPFLKWAGGKLRLVPKLKKLLPKDFAERRYVEPFVGGGAMFFSLEPKTAMLNDANADLIVTYEAVQGEVESVIRQLRKLARRHCKQHYYLTRERFNHFAYPQTASVNAARFIYLNKTCFNGLWRVNQNGDFNVPMGRYLNPQIVNEDVLRAASVALKGVRLLNTSALFMLQKLGKGDFVYADPPYDPISRTASFTGYSQGGFDREHQAQLHMELVNLDARGGKFMLSNSATPFIRELYRGFSIRTIHAPRSISAKSASRQSVKEFVICNY
jgi:DNA adenine methylase